MIQKRIRIKMGQVMRAKAIFRLAVRRRVSREKLLKSQINLIILLPSKLYLQNKWSKIQNRR